MTIDHITEDWRTCYKVYCIECFGSYAMFKKKTLEPPLLVQCITCKVDYDPEKIRDVLQRFLEFEDARKKNANQREKENNLRLLEEEGNYAVEGLEGVLFGFDTRGQSEVYREPTEDKSFSMTQVEKKKFDPNDPSSFKHSNLYKKW